MFLFDPNFIRKTIPFIFSKKLINMRINNGLMKIDVNDHIGYRFLMENGFDITVQNLTKKIQLSKRDIFLDIGANVGTICIPVAINTGCEVIAIEASKTNGSILIENAYINSIKMTPWLFCAVDEETYRAKDWIEFYIQNGNTGSNSIFSHWNPSLTKSQTEYVRTSTIDRIIDSAELSRIKLIKIDVEGAEELVLRGASKILDLSVPIIFEYRIDATEKYLGENGSRLVSILRQKFELFGIKDNQEFECFSDNKPYANAIALPKDKLNKFKKILEITI